MDKSKFERYAELKVLIKQAEMELDELKPTILEMMGDNEEAVLDGVGKFFINKRRTWTYPVAIQEQEAKLKEAKKIAEQKGEATSVENPVLMFSSEK